MKTTIAVKIVRLFLFLALLTCLIGSPAVPTRAGGEAVTAAPAVPALLQPTDNATGVTTSPTLAVTVSDPDVQSMNVSFYGRQVGETPGPDFTIVLIPDPQHYSTSYPTTYTNHLQWIATNKTISNTVFATALGDLVNTSTSATEYGRADAAFDTLDAGNVAYGYGPGNHDMTTGTLWASYFPASRISGKSYYGGSYNNYNLYSLFSASGMDFLLINLQYAPTTAILNWAEGLMNTYSSRRVIVESHSMLNPNNSFSAEGTTIYNALRDHNNLFLMVCGHNHTPTDGAAYIAGSGTGGAGQTIHIIMADYQDYPNGGNGYLRILRFSPANDRIYMTTYSPIIAAYINNTSNYDKADLVYDMTGISNPFTLIGTASGVASGSDASLVWSGLVTNTQYEWYAVASDGSQSTTSPTWSFTTGASGSLPPVISESDPQAVTMSEDGAPIPFNLLLHATDPNGDALTWSIAAPPANGAATASGGGLSKAIGYTPDPDYNGADSFTVQVADGRVGQIPSP